MSQRERVIRVDDDRDHPMIGEIVHTDQDPGVVWVTWGDLRFSDTPAEFAAREHVDELAPYPTGGRT